MRSRTRGSSWRRSAARRRSCAGASAWNVPAVTELSTPNASSRSTNSPAARRVNVTTSTWRASASCSRTRNATRRVEHAGLAGAGGREDRQRRARIGDGGALVRIEIGQQRVLVRHAGDRTGRVRRSPEAGSWARDAGRPRVVFAASQLRSPRGPSLGHCHPARSSPSRAPVPNSYGWSHAAPKGSVRPGARAPVPSPPGGGSGVGAAANRHRRQYDRAPRWSSGNWRFSQRDLHVPATRNGSCNGAATVPSRGGDNRRDRTLPGREEPRKKCRTGTI